MAEKVLLAFHIRQICHLISRHFDNSGVFSDEITRAQGQIIRYLCENKDRDIFQRDIEAAFGSRRSTVSVLLSSMEAGGFIERRSVDYDARLKRIVVTDKAAALHQRIKNEFDSYDMLMLKGITPEEQRVFFEVMDKIKKNIEENEERKDETDD
ncbi:MAG: MarR family winged helix-turn-helix transcriptional regulator [Ruminiclostridium sp.]